MAIGWISLLSAVPWKDVITRAPAIADSAKKLWKTVTKKEPLENLATIDIPESASADAETMAKVLAKLNTMETTITELHKQMLASSELIQALATQNTELIKRVEANRIRLRWISAVVLILVISITVVYLRFM